MMQFEVALLRHKWVSWVLILRVHICAVIECASHIESLNKRQIAGYNYGFGSDLRVYMGCVNYIEPGG